MSLLFDREKSSSLRVPVWFMRQAGRYHQHYQNIKKGHSFMEMCLDPSLATEVTLGPIQDFNFDAAIMFSDLLFPLDALGMGLSYQNGPPELKFHIKSHDDLLKLKKPEELNDNYFLFQQKTLSLLKPSLKNLGKDLLGFVGGPFTLYAYAVEGSHNSKFGLTDAKMGLYSGLYEKFLNDYLLPVLEKNIIEQAKASPDAICLFDTASGELSPHDFKKFVCPALRNLTTRIKKLFPELRIVYYSKATNYDHLRLIESEHIDVLGVDWRLDLANVLREFSKDYIIQGNIDPSWLFLPEELLKRQLDQLFLSAKETGVSLNRWVMGLGHGVYMKTPQQNVKTAVEHVKQNFTYQ